MPSGDRPDRPSRAQPNDQAPPPERDAPDPDQPQGQAGETNVDFGSYVSSTVRSSAELFGTPARSAPARRRSRPAATREPRTERAAADRPVAETERPQAPAAEPAPPRSRPSRYWRDSLGSREPVEGHRSAGDPGDGGGTTGGGLAWGFQDGNRPGLNFIIGAVLLGLLALIALIWFFNRDDGNGGDDPTPTATAESVIDPLPTTSPDGEPTAPFVFPTPGADDGTEPGTEPTPTPRRGGDNQRNTPAEETPSGDQGQVDLDAIELGPVARQCTDRCMVRVELTNDSDAALAIAQTRPSFQSDDWAWVIATAPGVAYLEQQTETVFIRDSPATLTLFMAIAPGEEATSDRPSQIGTVIDQVDAYRLIDTGSIPANVKPLTDWGYQVQKVAPPPPESLSVPEEPTSLATVEIGALLDDVSGSTIEQDIVSLQAMGSGQADGIGSRHYTMPGNGEAAEFLYTRLEELGLRVWYQDFMTWQGYLMVNVLAEIPGADESAVYGVMAHFDTMSDDVRVSPGADDNATGVAATLEIARILSRYQLAHPVHLVFVNVEEDGIIGSREFAVQAKEQGIPYEGVFNLDSIGAQRQYGYMVTNGDETTAWMSDLFREINDAYGLGQVINVQANENIVADDNRLREQGIDSMMIARELYGQSPYHHTTEDRLPTVWINGVVSATQLTLLSVASLVQT